MTKTFLDPHNPRLLCECCGFPTRVVPVLLPGIADYSSTTRDCPLCEWENAAVDAHGETLEAAADEGAERNGGHSLAEAQSNFRRFLSMYDPAQPEPWMPEPPTSEEMRWKEELVRQYKKILDPYAVDGPDALEQILALERTLSEAEEERVEEAQVPIEPCDEASPEASVPVWMSKGERGIEYFSETGLEGQVWPPAQDQDGPPPPSQSNEETRPPKM